ncbi:hypothetical protein [Herbaspirillum huttiense]|uniref:hypothetical protein n=1 Tax=Herbaspirillum huttiense TaxID=863372 RepID=UPI0039B0A2EB
MVHAGRGDHHHAFAASGARSWPRHRSSMDIVYLHSPITYSIARQLLREGEVRAPLVVCGRGMQWEGPHVSVTDDGIWDPARTVAFLEQMAAALPASLTPLRLFVPHTGYLVGKLLKLATAVQTVCYLEEGNTSCNALLARPTHNAIVDATALLHMLQAKPMLMQRLGLTPQAVLQVNAMPAIWFDAQSPKYGGAYRVSPQAFPGLPQVRTVSLAPQSGLGLAQRHWLCFLPNIINMVARCGQHSEEAQRNLHGLMSSLRTIQALVASQHARLVMKFHPVDEANLNPQFKQQFYGFGLSYASFAAQQAIDAQLEPALFDFTRFIVINESAASRYVELFQGLDFLISLNLF